MEVSTLTRTRASRAAHPLYHTVSRPLTLTPISWALFSLFVDFRQVVIPSNLNAQQFEESMQHKIMIFSGMYYGRLKEDDQNQEDFFEYVEKYIRDAQDTTSGYKNALT